MNETKLYFEDIDSTTCHTLEYHLENARDNGLTEITLVEAERDRDTKHHVFCGEYLEVVERCECTKANCETYTSKSGRGVCSRRGKLYDYGEEKTFKVE